MQKPSLFIVLLFASSFAHLCLFNPHQRGSLNGYETPAADDCALLTGPCGQRPEGLNVQYIEQGSNYTVVFMKNLDHWYQQAPGNFTVSISFDGETFTELGSTPDTNAPSLTYYVINFQLPSTISKEAILQTVYYPNNPQAPSAFYQCSDIGLIP